MQKLFLVLAASLLLFGGYYLFTNTNEPTNDMDANPVQIIPILHATGLLHWGDSTMYFDPTGGAEAFAGQQAADIVLVTDIHGDHLSTSTLSAVLGDAILIAPQAVKDMLPPELAARAVVLANGESVEQAGFKIEATPMYNVPESADAFHTKGRGNGYIIEKDGVRVLIAGDTGNTPELRAMQRIDIALVPMNLPYTMSIDDAAAAVLAFKPKTVYPYHYRGPGGLADVERFKELVHAGDAAIEVILAAWYPQQ